MQNAEQLFREAYAALNGRNFLQAERLFREFLKEYPRHVGALNLLTIALMNLELFAEAEKFIAKAVRLDETSDISYYNYGLILKRLGKPQQALQQFSKALRLNPNVADSWNNRGTVYNDLRRFKEAVADFDQALQRNPDSFEVMANKAKALGELGEFEEALSTCDKAIALKPGLAELWIGRGNILRDSARHEDALAAYDKAVALNANLAQAWLGRGNVLLDFQRLDEALAAFDKAAALDPDLPEVWINRGNVLRELKRYDEALAAYDRAFGLRPDLEGAWIGRGNLYLELQRYKEALSSYDKALAIRPDLAQGWLGRANVYQRQKRPRDAVAAYDKALALRPTLAQAWIGRGLALFEQNRDQDALASYDAAIALKTDIAESSFGKSIVKIALGDYAEALPLYEWRWRTRNFTSPARNFAEPLWLGDSDIAGKTILVHQEQGFGDAIQFARYVPLLQARRCRIVLEVHKRLAPLFATQWNDIQIVQAGDPLPSFDVHCPLLSLPLAFKTTVATIPAASPYLSADPEKAERWKARLGPKRKPRIGLVWSGNPNYQDDVWRSTRLEMLLPLLKTDREWFVLQKDIGEEDRACLSRNPHLTDLSESQSDFSDAAAIIAQMDLVVSVDTAVGHLAGALGKPVWLLLSFHANPWYMRDPERSPWYPSTRLFRQSKDGEWGDVIQRLSRELAGAS